MEDDAVNGLSQWYITLRLDDAHACDIYLAQRRLKNERTLLSVGPAYSIAADVPDSFVPCPGSLTCTGSLFVAAVVSRSLLRTQALHPSLVRQLVGLSLLQSQSLPPSQNAIHFDRRLPGTF